jgi:hypothetical protein
MRSSSENDQFTEKAHETKEAENVSICAASKLFMVGGIGNHFDQGCRRR